MINSAEIPQTLYKYRRFDSWTIDALIAHNIKFTDPADFNDPLDTSPVLEADIPSKELERILAILLKRRIGREMETAAKSLRYRGPNTLQHIVSLIDNETCRTLDDIRYMAGDPSLEVDDPLQFLLRQSVEEELLLNYDKGAFSLAESADSPLMWSHYGDEHRGLCMGYSVPLRAANDIHMIEYGGSRLIGASSVAAMLDGDEAARNAVDSAVLLRKAVDWQYEKEWRLLARKGVQKSPLKLEEVVFGMRCQISVKYMIMRALEDREPKIRFYEIRPRSDSFILDICPLGAGEFAGFDPRRIQSLSEEFFEVPDDIQKPSENVTP